MDYKQAVYHLHLVERIGRQIYEGSGFENKGWVQFIVSDLGCVRV